ncbi:MAG: hypothetical protein ACD_62C00617G0002, partial [uncultured bacterium]
MKTNTRILMLGLYCVLCAACSGSGTPINAGAVPASDPVLQPGYEDEGSTTSITVIGNPSLDVDTSAQVYLTLNQDTNNLKLFGAESLTDVLSFAETQSDGKTVASTATTVPAVTDFVLGPNQEMALVLTTPALVNEENCALVYATNEGLELCAQTAPFTVSGRPQFDAEGKLYYFGQADASASNVLVRWDPATETKTDLINQNISLTKWLVHAGGVVYLLGKVDQTDFFRSVLTDGSVTNLLSGSAVVQNFNFASSTTMILQADNVTFDDALVSGYFGYDLTQNAVTSWLDITIGDLDTLALDSLGAVYVTDYQKIYKIFPGATETIDAGFDKINLFRIYADAFYVAGQQGLESKLLKVTRTAAGLQTTTLMPDCEVYHLVADDAYLYYDALNFATNTLGVGKYTLTNSNDVVLETINQPLVQLESVYSVNNNSFTENTAQAVTTYSLVRAATTSTTNTI